MSLVYSELPLSSFGYGSSADMSRPLPPLWRDPVPPAPPAQSFAPTGFGKPTGILALKPDDPLYHYVMNDLHDINVGYERGMAALRVYDRIDANMRNGENPFAGLDAKPSGFSSSGFNDTAKPPPAAPPSPTPNWGQRLRDGVDFASEYVVPGYYFAKQTQNQFNTANDAWQRGDYGGAFGHGALGIANGIATGADVALGLIAPPARVGVGALAAGVARTAPVIAGHAVQAADTVIPHLSEEATRFWHSAIERLPDLQLAISSYIARSGGRWGNQLTKAELQEIVDAVVREHPNWNLQYGRRGLVDPRTGTAIETGGELRIPGPGQAWLSDSRPGSRFIDLGFVDENNRLRLLVELADVDKNGNVTDRELQAALRAFSQNGYLEREFGAQDLRIDVIGKRWQKSKP